VEWYLPKRPEKWMFPNKMTLRAAWHRYFLPDHESCICPLRYLTSTDMANQKNGRRNLSNLKSLMNYMIGNLKDCNKYIEKPNEKEVDMMYREGSGHVLQLTNSPRSECFS
jgi:hypothetical protein